MVATSSPREPQTEAATTEKTPRSQGQEMLEIIQRQLEEEKALIAGTRNPYILY